jgi:hypothetical protein
MSTHRNVVTIVASALLLVSLPAGAQVLGGNLGGAAHGGFGGGLGRAGISGAASATGNAAIDASRPAQTVRERSDHVRGRTLEAGAAAAGTARSRVDSTRGTADATTHTATSVGVAAGRRTIASATHARNSVAQSAAAQSNVQPVVQPNGVLINGSGAAAAEQHALGRSVSAGGATQWEASGDRSQLRSSAASQAEVSVTKDAAAE